MKKTDKVRESVVGNVTKIRPTNLSKTEKVIRLKQHLSSYLYFIIH